MTIILVTHEADVARYASPVVRFHDGRVISDVRQQAAGAMTYLDAILSALDALRLHKLRSALTMLGIIIGVAAVIAMMAVGAGARERVVAQISQSRLEPARRHSRQRYPGWGAARDGGISQPE